MENKSLRGAWGEALAAEYLRKKRYAVIACNYRCRFGEIDVIAQNRRYVVFVEVKLRKSGRYGSAAEFVDTRKQERDVYKRQVGGRFGAVGCRGIRSGGVGVRCARGKREQHQNAQKQANELFHF